MSILAAFRQLKSTSSRAASTAVLHTSAPSPACAPVVVRPPLPPSCSQSATIQLWVAPVPCRTSPRMRRSITEGPRPLLYGLPVMKRTQTQTTKDVVEVNQRDNRAATKKVSLVRSRAIRRAGRRESVCS
ncbi:hypothetical protein K438DRAFT_381971 [Mycena galopus ATCC 62051]|nr:hypothetical protein K438DRAFT_381971 [Mycena galopus ATCC 62051]